MNKLMLAGIIFTAIGTIILAKVTELHKKAVERYRKRVETELFFQLGKNEPIVVVGYIVAPFLLLAGLIMIISAASS